MKPLVTVITTTYNHQKFIHQCVVSVISQTYKNWEMIIVDDNSSDKTSKIVSKLAAKYPRISWIRHGKRWGISRLSDSYNQALKRAKGDLIAILEGDDFWPKNKLEKQVGIFQNKEVILSFGNSITVNEDGMPVDLVTYKKNPLLSNDPTGSILKLFADIKFFLKPETVMVSRVALNEIGGFQKDKRYPFVDMPTWWKLALAGPFFYQPEVLGFYRRHSASWWIKEGEKTGAMHKLELEKSFIDFLETNRSQIQNKEFNLNREEIIRLNKTFLEMKMRNKNFILLHHAFLFGNTKKLKEEGAKILRSKEVNLLMKFCVYLSIKLRPLTFSLLRLRFYSKMIRFIVNKHLVS